jgi:peptidoglycan/LPS O-acetylase OafA/YrhL
MYFTNRNAFEKPGASGKFLLRRIIRIVPTYWAYTTLVTALLLFLPQLFQDMKFGLYQAIGSYLFLLFVNTNGQVGPNIGVGWTLSFEMYFYLLFSLFLFFPRRLLLIGLGTIFACGIAARQFFSDIPLEAQLFTNPLLLEFFLGCCIGALASGNRFPSAPVAICLCAFGAVAILVAGQMNLLGDRFDPQRIIVFGIPAACIVYGAVALETQKLLKVPSFLIALGDSSYSMYLIQVFTIPVVGKGWKALGLANYIGPWAPFIVGIGVTVGVAHVLYLIFERPVTDFLRRVAAQHAKRQLI